VTTIFWMRGYSVPPSVVPFEDYSRLTTILTPSVDGYKGGYRLGPAQYFAVIVSVSPTDE